MRLDQPPLVRPRQDITLVDERNRAVGAADKLRVHQEGLLHRAFSVFLVDAAGRLLLQRRHPGKYHSGGLWTNACCGHPYPGERTLAGARRRTREELGVAPALTLAFKARYRCALDNDLVENELVYVFVGRIEGEADPDPAEIDGLRYETLEDTLDLVRRRPGGVSRWMQHYFAAHLPELKRAVALQST